MSNEPLSRPTVWVRSLPVDTAARVRDLVSETFGGGWDGFLPYIGTDSGTFGHEWRFQGKLGFGGKLHLNCGRLFVSCYPQDETPILRAAIAHINAQLEQVVQALIDAERQEPICEWADNQGR